MESSRHCSKYYLKASSLIESVIAITIIAICLLVALKLYSTILGARPSINNHRLKFQVDKLVSEMKLNPSFTSEVYDFKTYKIRKTISDTENSQQLKKVSYSIEQPKDTITYQYYILADED